MADGTSGEGRSENRTGRLWPLFIGLPLIAVIAVAAVVFAGGGDRAPQSSGQEQRPAGGEEQASSGGGDGSAPGNGRLGHPALGDADAPVVMVEYSDYQ